MPTKTPQAKSAVVTCCSHSQGAPSVRVTTSQNTVSVNMKMHTPHRTINTASSQSNARHLRCRWRWRISARKSAIPTPDPSCGYRAMRRRRRFERLRSPMRMLGLLHVADELQELDRMRTELRRQLVLDRLRRLDEASF